MINGDSQAVANLVAERIEIGEVSALAGFRVLALHLDVLAAVRYLRTTDSKSVSDLALLEGHTDWLQYP